LNAGLWFRRGRLVMGLSSLSAIMPMSRGQSTHRPVQFSRASSGFFAKLSKRRLRRGVFHSIVELQAAINRFVREHNAEPKPFTWTADPDKIIAAVRRGHQVLDSIH
jgi:hypothetical protein